MSDAVHVMTFGKFKGQPVTAVSDQALQHYLAWDQLRVDQRAALQAEVARRKAGGAPTSTPPTMPRPADRVRLCAFDLVAAGHNALGARYPQRIAVIDEAGQLLRTLLESTPAAPLLAQDEVPF